MLWLYKKQCDIKTTKVQGALFTKTERLRTARAFVFMDERLCLFMCTVVEACSFSAVGSCGLWSNFNYLIISDVCPCATGESSSVCSQEN